MVALQPLLALLLLQAPGDGWGMADTTPGQVKRVYWDLFKTTEVWLTVSPATRSTVKGPRMAFLALFPGKEVKGAPGKLSVRALPGQDVGELSLRFTIDGRVADVGAAPGVRYLYPPCEECSANGLEVDLSPEMVRALARAKTVQAHVLGQDVEFSPEDRAGLRQFIVDIGLEPEP